MRNNARWIVARDAACGLARWNGRVDQKRLDALRKEMGVEWPVRIKRMAGTSTNGVHRTDLLDYRGGQARYYHKITMSTYLSVHQANATLKHELRHAVQVEQAVREGQAPQEFQADYTAERRSQGYKRMRYEIEAREASLMYEDAITQNPLLSPRETQRAREAMPTQWRPIFRKYIQRMMKEHQLPELRTHFASIADDQGAPPSQDVLDDHARKAYAELQARKAREALQVAHDEARAAKAQQKPVEAAPQPAKATHRPGQHPAYRWSDYRVRLSNGRTEIVNATSADAAKWRAEHKHGIDPAMIVSVSK